MCTEYVFTNNFNQISSMSIKTYRNIPSNAEQCVQEASDGTLKWEDIQKCLKSNQANELLYQSIKRTQAASAKKILYNTFKMENFGVCMMELGMDVKKVEMKKVLFKAICSTIMDLINSQNVLLLFNFFLLLYFIA